MRSCISRNRDRVDWVVWAWPMIYLMFGIGFDENTISELSQCYVGPSLWCQQRWDSSVMYCIFEIFKNWIEAYFAKWCGSSSHSADWVMWLIQVWCQSWTESTKGHGSQRHPRHWSGPSLKPRRLKKVYENLKQTVRVNFYFSGTRWKPCKLAFALHRCVA